MILTLAWKELREHQGVWLTMAIMTVLAAWGLPQIVAMGDPRLGVHVAALTLLGLAATYGVVCGSMMFAGEHEGGTLVFLDIFHGRRGLLWFGKGGIGMVLVATQALAVALAFSLLNQEPPDWAMALVGQNNRRPDARVWLPILPIVALEAYAFGLLGSSLTRRVLAGAAVAAVGVTPVWLFSIMTPPPVFFTLQLVIAIFALVISYATFVNQSREATAGPPPIAEETMLDPKEQFLKQLEEFERDDDYFDDRLVHDVPVVVPIAEAAPVSAKGKKPTKPRPTARAPSPTEVLWWLTFQQAWPVLWILGGACLLVGLIMPVNAQVLWPLATLLLGVVCGTAAFASEQRDLSYQFLSAQHFPLKTIWRFKLLFWFAVAVLGTVVLLIGHFVNIALRGAVGNLPAAFPGTVPERLGPVAFFTIWLVYGFCTGQVFVWLARKSILAVLNAFLVGAGAITPWLPSLFCGGMSGWQLWVLPLTMILATWSLMRAWAGGRIQERKPMLALIGFGTAAAVWVLMNFGYRTLEVPNVGRPIDTKEYRARLPIGHDAAAVAINDALGHFENRDARWLESIAELPKLPVGVIETPRADLQLSLLKHLPACQIMTSELLRLAQAKEPGPAFEHIAQVLALSRNLRNKATLTSYLSGVEMEKDALHGLDQWLNRRKSTPKLLRQALTELNRHAAETPPAMDCAQTECFRSSGFLLRPSDLILPAPGEQGKVPERWLTGAIALSVEAPWEAERNARIWQLTWAGLFRAVETPHWQLPEPIMHSVTKKAEAQTIMKPWIPAAEGPGAGVTHGQVLRLLESSWLCNERFFCSVVRLREASTRAQCRVDAMRLGVALSLYRIDESKQAKDLQDLAPKYLPAGVPIDPYSGQSYRFRVRVGEATIWSTGPDRVDHGGHKNGDRLADDDGQWLRGDLDLITVVPQ